MPRLSCIRLRGEATGALQTDDVDVGAAAQLVGSYPAIFRELRAMFQARGVPADESADLAQESILRTIVHLTRHGQARDDVRPLVRTIARNLLVTRVRQRHLELVPLTTDDEIADLAQQPLDEIVESEQREAVQAAIRSLSMRHRRVVGLWMQGLTPAQIARELGIKRNAADALLHRARRRLASKLDGRVLPGILGLVFLRVRNSWGKLGDAMSRLDPTGTVAQATSGLAAVAITAALLASAPAIGTRAVPDEKGFTSPSVGATVEVKSVHGQAALIDTREAATPAVSAPREYRVVQSPKVDSPTREGEEVGLDLVYEPDHGNHHVVDGVIAPAVDAACGPLPC